MVLIGFFEKIMDYSFDRTFNNHALYFMVFIEFFEKIMYYSPWF